MAYIDGYIIPLPKRNLTAYKKLALFAGKLWKEHGAVEYWECVADDMKAKGCPHISKIVRMKPKETLLFSWILYRSKQHRNSVNKKVMNDPRMRKLLGPMPFDMKRFGYAGFKPIVRYAKAAR